MYNITITVTCLLFCLIFAGELVARPANDISSKPEIAFVTSHNQPVYKKIVNVAKAKISKNLHTIDERTDNTYLTKEWLLLSTEEKQSYKLIVAVGTVACGALLKEHGVLDKNKLLCTFIPKQAFQQLIRQSGMDPKGTDNIAAIYLDQPILLQAAFIRQLLPSVKRVSMLVSTSNKESVSLLQDSIRASGLSLSILLYDKNKTTENELRQLISSNDVFLALPDPEVHSPRLAKWLLYNAYREKKPVVAFSESYIRAGALAAIYSTPEQIGRKIGDRLTKLLINKQSELLNTISPQYYSIAVNRTVSTSLGLKIREEPELIKGTNSAYHTYSRNIVLVK